MSRTAPGPADRDGTAREPRAAASRPGGGLRGWRDGLRTGAPEAWPAHAVVLAVTATLLLAVGLVMTFSASFVEAAREGSPTAIAQRQLVWAGLGVPVALLLARTNPHALRRLAWPALVITVLLCTVVLVPGIGVEAHGARRWLSVGPVGLQPSELAKLAVPLLVAHAVALRWAKVRRGDLHALLLPGLWVIALLTALVLAGPDLEMGLLVAAGGAIVLLVAGLPGRLIGAGIGVAVMLAGALIVARPFRMMRLTAWLDPAAHAGDVGYQSQQGFIALASGGLTGRGLGQGRGQWLYVPNAHTDFIYAIIGEELGLLGALAVLLGFAALVVAGVIAARRAATPFERLLAASLTGWLSLQALMNMGSVVGLLPVTGVTLPLISFGGTSLLVTLAAVGVLVAIARRARPAPSQPSSAQEAT